MERVIDLSIKPYATPEGYAAAAVNPKIGWEVPETPVLNEPLSKTRNVATILSYNKWRLSMMGVQPGETFNYGVLTTKPYGTYMTFFNPDAAGRFAVRYPSDLPADSFAGKMVLIDLSDQIKPGDVIQLSHLEPLKDHIRPGAIVFLRTDYSKKYRPVEPSLDYFTNSPTLSREAAEWLVEGSIKTLGADVRTLDPAYAGRPADYDIRLILNKGGVLVVEDLANLDQIREQHDYAITGLPLGIRGVTGGPARVFAINRSNPTDFVDCTHPLEYYPDRKTEEYPFVPPKTERPANMLGDYPNPMPGRIEPRETMNLVSRMTRLLPFNVVDPDRGVIGREMYIQYGHGTTTHIEAAYFDPWGRHMVPDAIMRRYVRMPADRLIGQASLIDLSDMIGPGMQIELEHILEADPGVKEGDIVFVRTQITESYFYGQSTINLTPGFTAEATKWLVEKKIRVLALDSPSNERSEPINSGDIRYTSNKLHYLLHRNDIPVMDEGTRFRNISKKRFIAAIMALPVSHQSGFPAHTLVIEDMN